MKDAIYVAIILLHVCIIVYFIRRGKVKANKGNDAVPQVQNVYYSQRSLALSITPAQLGLNIPGNIIFVYGVVMDWNTGENIVTLAAYITGAANVYFSEGGGVSGAGKNPIVGEAAVVLVSSAADYMNRVVPINDVSDVVAPDCVRFHLLTNKQIYAAQEHVKYFDDGSSPWLEIFQKGNEVILNMNNDKISQN